MFEYVTARVQERKERRDEMQYNRKKSSNKMMIKMKTLKCGKGIT